MLVRGRRIGWPVIGLVVIVLAGGGAAYAVTGRATTPSYRTVPVTRSDVEQTLTTSGLVDAARRADLSFATAGTVASIDVALGDTVRTGQVIARLDTTSLDASLTQARASLAKAIAQLASDQAAQAAAVSKATTASTTKSAGSASGSGATATQQAAQKAAQKAAQAAALKQLKILQGKVLDAQSAASAAIVAAKTALTTQGTACAGAFTGTPTPNPADAACTAALAVVQNAQDAVSTAQDALAKALDALTGALMKALGGTSTTGGAGASGGSHSGSARTTAAAATQPQTTGSQGAGQGSQSGGTVTAARLASDQAQIDQARADVVTAEQKLGLATLRSTRAGRVVALDVLAGASVAAGKTVATVVGGRAVTVTGLVSEARIASVQLGQVAQVMVPGISTATTGRVSAIGLVPDTSSGTTSYPVTVTVDDPTISLPTGSRALMQIVIAIDRGVLTVPISAIVMRGTATSVRTWNGTTLGTQRVTLGAIGARKVVVVSGLTAGTRVVLASIDAAITGASSTLNQRGGFGGAGFQFRRAGGTGGAVTFGGAGP